MPQQQIARSGRSTSDSPSRGTAEDRESKSFQPQQIAEVISGVFTRRKGFYHVMNPFDLLENPRPRAPCDFRMFEHSLLR